MQVRFEQTMNEPAGEVTLLGVNEDAAHEVARHHDGGGVAAIVHGSDLVRLQTQSEGHRREQFAVGAI
jgi:hypothetical protein